MPPNAAQPSRTEMSGCRTIRSPEQVKRIAGTAIANTSNHRRVGWSDSVDNEAMNRAPANSVEHNRRVPAVSGEKVEMYPSAVVAIRDNQAINQNSVCPRRCLWRIHANISNSTDDSAKLSPRTSTLEFPRRVATPVFYLVVSRGTNVNR